MQLREELFNLPLPLVRGKKTGHQVTSHEPFGELEYGHRYLLFSFGIITNDPEAGDKA